MKKFIILLTLLSTTVNLFAQDVITKLNGDEIQAKVLNINDTEINYIKWSNLNGPTYTISKNEVFMIKYENGEKDVFNNAQSSTTVSRQNANPSNEDIISVFRTTNKENNVDFLKRKSLLRKARGWNIAGSIIAIGGVAGGICLGTFGDGQSLVGASLAMGIPALLIGTYCWVEGGKKKREAYKIDVASIPVKRIKIQNVYLEPNISYLSYHQSNAREGAWGIGTKISF